MCAGVDELLRAITRDGRVPAATIEVGDAGGSRYAAGFAGGAPSAAALEAVWDLASLTKVLSTTSLAAHLVQAQRLRLDDALGALWPRAAATAWANTSIRDLLCHASGLPAHLPLYRDASSKNAILQAILGLVPEYPPRQQSVYSDLGFMLLGAVLEQRAGCTLAEAYAQFSPVEASELAESMASWAGYVVPSVLHARLMSTGTDAWRGERLLTGEVHDRNAAAMGSIAGHAGMFGTATAVGAAARRWLGAYAEGDAYLGRAEVVRAFFRRSPVPGSSRALGWDTMLPTSSCGEHLSRQAVGHTGFTGTSVWIDPALDVYVVLLTNRVAGSASDHDIATLRRAVHDVVASAVRARRADSPEPA